MPQVLRALLPHSPLLIDEIGKENKIALQKTENAYQQVAKELKEKQVESIIVISQEGEILDDSFSLGIAPEFNVNFSEFACFKKRTSLKNDLLLSDKLLETINHDYPLTPRPIAKLDHGSAIPLELLTKENKDIKVLPLYCANNLDWKTHYQFGLKLKEFIDQQTKKIAIIASGDLSHRLKVSSPGGFSPKAVKFDNKIMQYLSEPENASDKLLNLNPKSVNEAKESVLKPLLVLLGIIGSDYKTKKLAYQDDFGVGYLSVLFNQ